MDTDAALATRLAIDLPGTFPDVVRAHQDRLYSIALRMLGDPRDAEEAAQDAFVRAHRAVAAWPADRIRALRLRPWLATIVVNAARTRGRRRAARPPEVGLTDLELRVVDPGMAGGNGRSPDAAGPESVALRNEAAGALAADLAALPLRYRTAVVLRHVDGLTYAEMAEALGRPEPTLRAQVHRGLALLRATLEARERAVSLGVDERPASTTARGPNPLSRAEVIQ
jgi:RNA polymerase sigma-70 factor (ECF subfamily)